MSKIQIKDIRKCCDLCGMELVYAEDDEIPFWSTHYRVHCIAVVPDAQVEYDSVIALNLSPGKSGEIDEEIILCTTEGDDSNLEIVTGTPKPNKTLKTKKEKSNKNTNTKNTNDNNAHVAMADSLDFRGLLKKWKLSQYADIMEEEGYDDHDDWKYLTDDILENELGFKKGHIRKFKRNLGLYIDRRNEDMDSKASEEKKEEIIENFAIHSGKGVPHKCNGKIPDGWKESKKDIKNVVFVGGTGTGKTSTINSAVHYLFASKYEQPRTYLIKEEEKSGGQADSQTDTATIYHLEPYSVKYMISLIDTPGFGDTRNINEEKQTDTDHTKSISSCFRQIEDIDAIVFVIRSSDNRYTQQLKYIFDKMLSLFGKDIEDNIFIVFTFSNFEEPSAMDAIRKCNIPYKNYYLIENGSKGGLFSAKYKIPKDALKKARDQCNYLETVKSLKALFDDIGKTKTVSLQNSQKVIKDRNLLESYLKEIPKMIGPVLDVMSNIKQNMELFKKHESDMKANANFTCVVREPHSYKRDVDKWNLINNDKKIVCCENCRAFSKKWCEKLRKYKANTMKTLILTEYNVCMMCGDDHDKHDYELKEWVHTTRVVTKKYDDLLEKYDNAKSKKSATQKKLKVFATQLDNEQDKVKRAIMNLVYCINRLNGLALKANTETPASYIDGMIENERNNQNDGYKDRVNELKKMKVIMAVSKCDAEIEKIWEEEALNYMSNCNISNVAVKSSDDTPIVM